MRVVVADVDAAAASQTAQLLTEGGAWALPVQCDVADQSSVEALAHAVGEQAGPVRLLCNNAGVSIRQRVVAARTTDWAWTLGVNLWGVIHGLTAFLPGILDHGEPAHIVNTASMNGLFPSRLSAMYSASKYGVVGLTETLINELSGTTVRVSLLCPSAVRTRIHESERNREAAQRTAAGDGYRASARYVLSAPLDASYVGELTLEGVSANRHYIFTDPRIAPILQQRHEQILAAVAEVPRLLDLVGAPPPDGEHILN
jgi:NAD(P)-dependent dehydrogenase (short-subunit alcohol dehydrogenase family)